jgi:prostaglandin-endoperoxide synthase 2
MHAEDLRKNSALPPMIGRLVGIDAFSQALTNPLLAENVFNKETFTPVGWEEIMSLTTLSQLVHRNVPDGQKFTVGYRNADWKPAGRLR